MRKITAMDIKASDARIEHVEYLTDRSDTAGPFELWQQCLVHKLGDTAWVLHARYSGTLMVYGTVVHLYCDKQGLFGVDDKGLITDTVFLGAPTIKGENTRLRGAK